MRLKDKIAIVTGASKGIGKGIAEVFAKEGADLVITGRTDMKGLDDTYNKIVGLGRQALKLQVDVGKVSDIDKMVRATVERFGRVDILVNNAGILNFKGVLDTTEEDWDRIVATNLKGPYFATKRVIPEMKKTGKGKVIQLASTAGFRTIHEEFSAYGVTKAGIVQMVRSMAVEFGPMHINVNAIAPGPIATELFTAANPANSPRTQAIINEIPLKRMGQPEDVANLTTFLASDESSFITGQVIFICGELTVGLAHY